MDEPNPSIDRTGVGLSNHVLSHMIIARNSEKSESQFHDPVRRLSTTWMPSSWRDLIDGSCTSDACSVFLGDVPYSLYNDRYKNLYTENVSNRGGDYNYVTAID